MTPTRATTLPVASSSRMVLVGQWTGLAAFAAMIGGLFGAAETALPLLWFVLVPAVVGVVLLLAAIPMRVLVFNASGAASGSLLAVTSALARVGPALGLLLAASLSGALFYWFVSAAMTAALGWSPWATGLLRVVGIGLVAIWTVLAFRRRRARHVPRRSGPPSGRATRAFKTSVSREESS